MKGSSTSGGDKRAVAQGGVGATIPSWPQKERWSREALWGKSTTGDKRAVTDPDLAAVEGRSMPHADSYLLGRSRSRST